MFIANVLKENAKKVRATRGCPSCYRGNGCTLITKECDHTRCGRCGEEGTHWEGECMATGPLPFWAIFQGPDVVPGITNHDVMEAWWMAGGSRVKGPMIWWGKALKRTSDRLQAAANALAHHQQQANVAATAAADQARLATEKIAREKAEKARRAAAKAKSEKDRQTKAAEQAARNAKELAVMHSKTPFSVGYIPATMSDEPVLVMGTPPPKKNDKKLATPLPVSLSAPDKSTLEETFSKDKLKNSWNAEFDSFQKDNLNHNVNEAAHLDNLQNWVGAEGGLNAIHAFRPGASTSTLVRVLSNNFTLDISPLLSLHHYKVTMVPVPDDQTKGNKPKEGDSIETTPPINAGSEDDAPELPRLSRAIRRMVVSKAIEHEQCVALKANPGYFATDFVDTIVAWKDLQLNTGEFDVLLRPNSDTDRKIFRVKLHPQSPVPLSRYVNYLKSNVRDGLLKCNTSEVARLLNIFVSRHVFQRTEIVKSLPQSDDQTEYYKLVGKKYFSNVDYKTLEGGFCAIRGFSTNVVPGVGTAYLNINVGASAFFRPITVHEFLSLTSLTTKKVQETLRGVRVYVNQSRKDAIKGDIGLDLPSARVKTIQSIGIDKEEFIQYQNLPKGASKIDQLKAKRNGTSTSVKNCLLARYGNTWQGANRTLCVNVGSTEKGKESWFPADKLTILPYQPFKGQMTSDMTSGMIEFAQKAPDDNQRLIYRFAEKALGIKGGQTGIELIPGVDMLDCLAQHPAGNLPPPQIRYALTGFGSAPRQNDLPVLPVASTGKWNLSKTDKNKVVGYQKLHTRTSSPIILYGIVGVDADYEVKNGSSPQEHFDTFRTELLLYGLEIQVPNPQLKVIGFGAHDWATQMASHLSTITQVPGVNTLVVLLLPKKDMKSKYYAKFKTAADMIYGLSSGCITQRPEVSTCKDYFGNVALKVNLKFPNQVAGVSRNHILENRRWDNTLIMGADVTHPGPGSIAGTPSIAAVIGSDDSYSCHYTGSMKLQKPEDDKLSKEIIPCADMEVMVKQCLESHLFQTKRLADKIVFYRDGVSQAGIAKFRAEEVTAVRSAHAKLKTELQTLPRPERFASLPKNKDMEIEGFNLKITAVVGEKRHHTRFYSSPVSEELITQRSGKKPNLNIKTGTFVEFGPTSPFFFDFFLQSHNGLQGTVKPTHYFVVVNENNRDMDHMLTLTHQLSFVYQRATMPVSYVAPTYYADHLAERGRKYLKPFLDGDHEVVAGQFFQFRQPKSLAQEDAEEKAAEKAKKAAEDQELQDAKDADEFGMKDDSDDGGDPIKFDADALAADWDNEWDSLKKTLNVSEPLSVGKVDARFWYNVEEFKADLKKPESSAGKYAKKCVFEAVKKAFETPMSSERGPWHKNLDGSMFWL